MDFGLYSINFTTKSTDIHDIGVDFKKLFQKNQYINKSAILVLCTAVCFRAKADSFGDRRNMIFSPSLHDKSLRNKEEFMSKIETGMSGYLHTYEAYRVPKGTSVKNASGEDIVLSNEEDVLVLTKKAGKQLVKDRRAHNGMLQLKAELAAQKTQNAANEKNAEDQAKIMAVYRAIAKGDIVPASDERKLQEYSADLYQAAKMAQSMAQINERKKHASQWDEEEEDAYNAKKKALCDESNEAAAAAITGARDFSNAQKKRIVEIDSSNIDFSSMEVMSLGAGVTGVLIDLSI